ncbi:hypothetical protein M9H77_03660 [Catharanthus roseus]|uniref:Uncharacterized protein n=1 Tax=Catharanthus roseus TaxID=4058 RepID=A0ACC0CBU5_CATRO|nr:hypothetical protein M9H77_03660 [Catharanthus roseus]
MGNRGGMYEVTQNVDLSLKVDALSKKFDQLLALNTLPINSLNMQALHHALSILSRIFATPSPLFFQVKDGPENPISRNPHSSIHGLAVNGHNSNVQLMGIPEGPNTPCKAICLRNSK